MKFTLKVVINCSIRKSDSHPIDHHFDAIAAVIRAEGSFLSPSDIQHSEINLFHLNFRTQITEFSSGKNRWHWFADEKSVGLVFISEISSVQLRFKISVPEKNYGKLNHPMVSLWIAITIILRNSFDIFI
jgi:hypothetical protein